METSEKRFVVEQGGTRSGKTYNILIWIVFAYCLRNTGKIVTITRKHGPALRGSSMRDFFTILQEHGLYSEGYHRKSYNEYVLNNNIVEFVSLDEPQKIRGRKRDLLFLNEGNELYYEDFFQLNVRTAERVIIDYNPSDEFHWIYDRVIPRDDCAFYKTTYKDNPFIGKDIVKEIERLKHTDENYWRIYGLGERGISQATIFTHWTIVDKVPEEYTLMCYGLDFGYTNDPTTLVAVYTDGESFLLDEILYATGMTNNRIAQEMRHAGVGRHDQIIADSAEPKSIDEIHGYGFNIHPARKGQDSVRAGIDYMKSHGLSVTSSSLNGIKELRNYKYKEDKNGKVLNSPVDAFDHFIDASRYAIMFNQTNPNFRSYVVA